MLLALLSVGPARVGAASAADLPGLVQRWTAEDAEQVDVALKQLGEHRLIIEAADAAGLNLVLGRMQRADVLADVETAVVVANRVPYLAAMGLPDDRAHQLEVARAGHSRLIGAMRDDSGGVCISEARMTPWVAEHDWWVRAVVDDQRLCDGHIRSLTVRHVGPSEVQGQVKLGRFRGRTERGRALQLACDPAQILTDGIPRERPRGRRTFWAEPKLWRVALP